MEPVYRSVVALCLGLFRLKRWDVRVSGVEHVPREGGAVLASNHIGYLDFVFVGAGVLEATGDRLVRFAAKKEVFEHPVAGPLMRAMRHIPVDRTGAAHRAIDRAVADLRGGELVGMFPEATISRSFVPLRGKSGTVRMAQLAQVPVVPVAVWGSQRLLTKGRPRDLRRDVVITVDFGPPLHPSPDDDREAVTAELMASIEELVEQAQRRYPQRPAGEDDRWWLPAHLGGTAPTVEEAKRLADEEAARRRAERRARRAGGA